MSSLTTWSRENRAWVDEFVLAMRDGNAPGNLIGDQLTAAHEHCLESGRTPDAEFGSAKDYARSLGYEPAPPRNPGEIAGIVGIIGSMVVLMLIGSYAVRDWILGVPLIVNLGTLLCWIGMVVLLVVLGLLAVRGRGILGRLPVVLGLQAVAVVLGILGAVLSHTGMPEIFRGTPIPAAIVCVLLILALAVLGTRRALRTPSDRLSYPGEDERTRAAEDRKEKVLTVLPYWIIPAIMVVDAAFTAVAGAGTGA